MPHGIPQLTTPTSTLGSPAEISGPPLSPIQAPFVAGLVVQTTLSWIFLITGKLPKPFLHLAKFKYFVWINCNVFGNAEFCGYDVLPQPLRSNKYSSSSGKFSVGSAIGCTTSLNSISCTVWIIEMSFLKIDGLYEGWFVIRLRSKFIPPLTRLIVPTTANMLFGDAFPPCVQCAAIYQTIFLFK